jgi:predicted nucleic acid-binding protein
VSIRTALTLFVTLLLETRSAAALAQLTEQYDARSTISDLPYITLSAQVLDSEPLGAAYILAVRKALGKPIFSRYLWMMLQRYMHMCLMRMHPSLDVFKQAFLAETVVYLDTTVLIEALLPSEEFHSACRSACDYMNALGIRAVVTTHTLDEFTRVLEDANRLQTTSVATGHRNPFVRNFESSRKILEGPWDTFYQTLVRDLKPLLRSLGIDVDEHDYSELTEEPGFAAVTEATATAAISLGWSKRPEIVRHDALLLFLIRKLRQEAVGSGRYWFLSDDFSVYLASRALGVSGEPPLSVTPDVWLQTLSLFPVRDKTITDEFSRDAARGVMGFLGSKWSEGLPEFSRAEVRDILQPALTGKGFTPVALLKRAEEKLLQEWLETSPQARDTNTWGSYASSLLDLDQETIAEQEGLIRDLRSKVSLLERYRRVVSIYLTAALAILSGVAIAFITTTAIPVVVQSRFPALVALFASLGLVVTSLWWSSSARLVLWRTTEKFLKRHRRRGR